MRVALVTGGSAGIGAATAEALLAACYRVAFPYRLLWDERSVVSVANLTRADAREFPAFAQAHPLQVHVRTCPLAHANEALADLRAGRIEGAAVLLP